MVAHHRVAVAGGTAVDSHKLADSGVITNNSIGLLALVLQVLWVATNDSTRIDMAVFAYTYATIDSDVVINDCALANLNIVVDARKSTNSYTWMKLCFRMDKIHIFL